MSNNPFADSPRNPLVPSSGIGPPVPVNNPLTAPALVLLLLSVFMLMLILISLPAQVAHMREINLGNPEGQGELFGMIAALGLWTITMLVILLGSINMLRLRGYSGAMTAAIAASIPFCSPCFLLGIPFGIWAIILLRQDRVKAMFH